MRAEAMSVPAVAAARAIIINKLAGRPLRALRGETVLEGDAAPTWMYRTDTGVSPWHRMVQTLDDLFFYGDSLWVVERGSDNQITDAQRCYRDQWQVTSSGVIQLFVASPTSPDGAWIDAPDGSVVYIPAPFEGLLTVASRTIRGATSLEQAWTNQARTPLPAIIIEEREDNGMTTEEATEYVQAVAAARRTADGSVVMFAPYKVNVRVESGTDATLLVEARNAVKLDVANFATIKATELDAALPKASLNYETESGTAEVTEDRMSYWTDPIEARLSMDDVVPRGQRIRFDFNLTPTQTPADTGAYSED